MRELYIFDLDGTLALIDHRRPLIELQPGSPVLVARSPATFVRWEGTTEDGWVEVPGTGRWLWHKSDIHFKPDWKAFFAACIDDKPNLPVIATYKRLVAAGCECWIWSGRSDEVMAQTKDWLAMNCGTRFGGFKAPEAFRMRKAGDYTPDDVLKRGWLAEIEPPEYKRLTAVFDDRDRVVRMWRDAGVPCFQVAAGDF